MLLATIGAPHLVVTMKCSTAGLFVALAATVPGARAAGPDLELGEHLASECTTCHRADSVNQGIPGIFGIPSVVFIQTMEQYRDGTRTNDAMINVANSLTDEDIAALAAYLEQASPYK